MSAYVIARLTIHDPTTYDRYRAQTPAVIERFGGRFVVRGGEPQLLDGAAPPPERVVVIEFESRERARAFYDSPEYRAILPLRLAAADGEVLLTDGI